MEALKKLGLTEIEAKVYLTLLEEGPSLAGHISRKSGIHRRMVYDATERLIKKGLIGYIIQNNRRLFEAVNPERLLALVKEEEKAVNDILPQLKLKYDFAKEKQETNFYKGKAGLKSVFEDQIRDGKEILVLNASALAYELFIGYFTWRDERRKKKKIKSKLLFDEGSRKKLPKIPFAEIKFLPLAFESPVATNIYGNKVAIIFWSKENPFAIVIKQKEVADAYRNYFNVLWKTGRK